MFGSSKRALASLALIGALAATSARAEDSLLRSVAKSAGFATDPTPPPDFVVKSRPVEQQAPIPVFRTPDEPPSKVKSAAQLRAMDAELDGASRKHDKLRAAFPPAAKAMAEAERKTRVRKSRPYGPGEAKP